MALYLADICVNARYRGYGQMFTYDCITLQLFTSLVQKGTRHLELIVLISCEYVPRAQCFSLFRNRNSTNSFRQSTFGLLAKLSRSCFLRFIVRKRSHFECNIRDDEGNTYSCDAWFNLTVFVFQWVYHQTVTNHLDSTLACLRYRVFMNAISQGKITSDQDWLFRLGRCKIFRGYSGSWKAHVKPCLTACVPYISVQYENEGLI